MKSIKGTLFILCLAVISFVSLHSVSAGGNTTTISGVTYDANAVERLAGSSVRVTCYHGDDVNNQSTTSVQGGSYRVHFPKTGDGACDVGDWVVVTARNGDLMGSASDIVREDGYLDLLLIHVPMTPEFSFYMGILTLASSVGLFFILRKK